VAALQLSAVQSKPSLQLADVSAFTQPLPASQLSAVQALLSSQLAVVPLTQFAWTQVSPSVQASPSSQLAEFAGLRQPKLELQLSSVQTLPSEQSGATPPTHAVAIQTSLVVHRSSSSQDAEFTL
jgi:hypothetical protein